MTRNTRQDDAPTLASAGPRTFEIVEPHACYRLTVPDCGLSLEVDRLLWQKQELSGELLVRLDLAGSDTVDGVLSVTVFNLSSTRARSERAKHFALLSRAPDIPWLALLEQFCLRVLAAERTAEPAIALRDVPRPSTEDREIRVAGFRIPRQLPSMLFGDGGTGKSFLALWIGGLMARDGYRVLVADWELDAPDHRDRYERLFGTAMPATLFYVRCARPLLHEADSLTRIVRGQGIDFGIFDSVGFAAHDAPELATSALAYFNAVRRIGKIGSLHLAHVAKGEHGDQKPFGSTFWHNSARATWFLKTDNGVLGVFNRKAYDGPQAPFAIQTAFTRDAVRFTLTDIADEPAFAAQLPLRQRLRRFLRAGAQTREAIEAEFSDEKPETLRRIVNRLIEKGILVRFPHDGIEHIGLAEQRPV